MFLPILLYDNNIILYWSLRNDEITTILFDNDLHYLDLAKFSFTFQQKIANSFGFVVSILHRNFCYCLKEFSLAKNFVKKKYRKKIITKKIATKKLRKKTAKKSKTKSRSKSNKKPLIVLHFVFFSVKLKYEKNPFKVAWYRCRRISFSSLYQSQFSWLRQCRSGSWNNNKILNNFDGNSKKSSRSSETETSQIGQDSTFLVRINIWCEVVESGVMQIKDKIVKNRKIDKASLGFGKANDDVRPTAEN